MRSLTRLITCFTLNGNTFWESNSPIFVQILFVRDDDLKRKERKSFVFNSRPDLDRAQFSRDSNNCKPL